MSRVVIIHAAEDALPARALAEKLRQAKLEVVLEQQPGDALRAAIRSAKVAIALWSPRSAGQPGLTADAGFAQAQGGLIHATMQSTAVPQEFGGDVSVNLTGWRGEDDFAGWRTLLKLVASKAGIAEPAAPAARAGAGFFTPGRAQASADAQAAQPAPQAAARTRPQAPPAAPSPRAQTPPPRAASATPAHQAPAYLSEPDEPEQKRGGMMIVVAALAAVALLGGGFYVWSQQQGAASIEAAWDDVDTSDAASLRAFLAGNPGDYRDDAAAALANLEELTFEAASDADSIDALKAFLNDFPNSEHALEVHGRIAELQSLSTDAPPADAAAPPEEAQPPDPDLVPPTATGGGPATLAPSPATEASQPQLPPPPAPPPARLTPPSASPPN